MKVIGGFIYGVCEVELKKRSFRKFQFTENVVFTKCSKYQLLKMHTTARIFAVNLEWYIQYL